MKSLSAASAKCSLYSLLDRSGFLRGGRRHTPALREFGTGKDEDTQTGCLRELARHDTAGKSARRGSGFLSLRLYRRKPRTASPHRGVWFLLPWPWPLSYPSTGSRSSRLICSRPALRQHAGRVNERRRQSVRKKCLGGRRETFGSLQSNTLMF
jgi:hypothetical protein